MAGAREERHRGREEGQLSTARLRGAFWDSGKGENSGRWGRGAGADLAGAPTEGGLAI